MYVGRGELGNGGGRGGGRIKDVQIKQINANEYGVRQLAQDSSLLHTYMI